jgi:hypothetical protein
VTARCSRGGTLSWGVRPPAQPRPPRGRWRMFVGTPAILPALCMTIYVACPPYLPPSLAQSALGGSPRPCPPCLLLPSWQPSSTNLGPYPLCAFVLLQPVRGRDQRSAMCFGFQHLSETTPQLQPAPHSSSPPPTQLNPAPQPLQDPILLLSWLRSRAAFQTLTLTNQPSYFVVQGWARRKAAT